MAFKQKGWSPFKIDDKKTQAEIKTYIKNNMNTKSDEQLKTYIANNSDGKTEYNWNIETMEVESHDKQGKYNVEGGRNPQEGEPYPE
tara:strand:+ start:167 stop:427 length:261 start_codon:yes stop_codon:yes gene_type:complete